MAVSAGGGGGGGAAGQFGDTTLTKVFVGGLAWETQKEGMRGYFEQFGDILEAVVITDKNTGRSKGYGFVTFREPEAAMKACFDPYPVIDGRRANCNLAYLGVQRSKAAAASLQPYAGHMRAMKSSIIQTGGGGASLSMADHGIQQGIPTYNVYGYSPYFSDYGYPLSYYQAYGGLGAQYQMFAGGAAAAAAGLTMGNPTGGGLYSPYFQYGPSAAASAAAAAGYAGMQYPQMYQYAAAAVVGAPTATTASLTGAVAGLQQYAGTVALAPNSTGQAAGMTMSLTAPTLPAPCNVPPLQGRAHLLLAAFLGHRLPSQTNTSLFCTLCPHSCAPGKNFPVGHPSQIAPGQARLTSKFFGDWLPEKKLQLVDMSILLILLSPGTGVTSSPP